MFIDIDVVHYIAPEAWQSHFFEHRHRAARRDQIDVARNQEPSTIATAKVAVDDERTTGALSII
jgi:hypothetical protein